MRPKGVDYRSGKPRCLENLHGHSVTQCEWLSTRPRAYRASVRSTGVLVLGKLTLEEAENWCF
jgi:hypothetical protein